ncbi:hypothetical protein P3T76_001530 [Phytophthora citrophthora]|uniref:Fibrous sheath-interacting protein 1 n=1 Tax=Phytophthora citrophthora TaxID=4793 RepID=A0AAD9H028_9STRA|nr:hypothetical protein P3T76_001530 [Phytophthora citrophthora]
MQTENSPFTLEGQPLGGRTLTTATEIATDVSNLHNSSPLVTRSLQFGSDDHGGRLQRSEESQPRRPYTTPKPHIQRLLPSPGQNSTPEWHCARQSSAVSPTKLIRLPDSPPRSHSVRSEKDSLSSNEISPRESTEVVTSEPTSAANAAQFEDSSSVDSENEARDSIVVQVPEDKDKGSPSLAGPVLEDICSEEAETTNQENCNGIEDSKDIRTEDFDDTEYEKALEGRKWLLDNEAERQRIRDELEMYVGSLSSRTDGNGEHLVEFPQNYHKIVSLMTQKDVNEVEPMSKEGEQTRQSWSRVLIESGLSKQQAFGILEDVDDDPEGSSLAAKIALKMARIRQLDTILEEKLGKNLYASIVPKKQKKAQSLPQSSTSGSRTFVTQTTATTSRTLSTGGETGRSNASTKQSTAVDDPVTKKISNFIERNKQVVANGMKANMTKDEEDRLEKLLRDEPNPADDDSKGEENTQPQVETDSQECNEFTMSNDEKQAIEELIASKSSAYPLFAIDELQDGPTDEACHPSKDSSRPVKDNIIQETKRERLQRQRLSRVEQELRFLQESPAVVIVGDDRDEDENEDCRSELSYATAASSTCSTRSGVISRHDFKCFLAQQKENFSSTPTASVDEIRRLLLSINHGPATTTS